MGHGNAWCPMWVVPPRLIIPFSPLHFLGLMAGELAEYGEDRKWDTAAAMAANIYTRLKKCRALLVS